MCSISVHPHMVSKEEFEYISDIVHASQMSLPLARQPFNNVCFCSNNEFCWVIKNTNIYMEYCDAYWSSHRGDFTDSASESEVDDMVNKSRAEASTIAAQSDELTFITFFNTPDNGYIFEVVCALQDKSNFNIDTENILTANLDLVGNKLVREAAVANEIVAARINEHNKFEVNTNCFLFLTIHMVYSYLKICSIINCKNVNLATIKPDPKEQKRRKKRGDFKLYTYKVLEIKSHGKVSRFGQNPQGLWENRLHVCRGHFKTYTEERPLLGKITGTFWWPEHVRGSKELGQIDKEYITEEAVKEANGKGPSEDTLILGNIEEVIYQEAN